MQVFMFCHGLFADSLCVTAAYLGFIIKTIHNMISENTTMSSVCVYGLYHLHIFLGDITLSGVLENHTVYTKIINLSHFQ